RPLLLPGADDGRGEGLPVAARLDAGVGQGRDRPGGAALKAAAVRTAGGRGRGRRADAVDDAVRRRGALLGSPRRARRDLRRCRVGRELKMAEQLIASLSTEFDPGRYHDEYRERVLDLIERKAAGEEIAIQPEAEEPEAAPDLMAALEASLAAVRSDD